MYLPSGLNATWFTCFWCPVNRATGFFGFAAGGSDCTGGHRKRVWSSEPEMSCSGVRDVKAWYRFSAACFAVGSEKRVKFSTAQEASKVRTKD